MKSEARMTITPGQETRPGKGILFDRDTDCLLHFRLLTEGETQEPAPAEPQELFLLFPPGSTFPAGARLHIIRCSCWISIRRTILRFVLLMAPDLHFIGYALPGTETESPPTLFHSCIFPNGKVKFNSFSGKAVGL
jgi:hypothetical protein